MVEKLNALIGPLCAWHITLPCRPGERKQARAESLPFYESSFTGIALDIFLPLLVNGKVKIQTKFDTGTGIDTMINPYFLKALGIDPLADSVDKRSFQNPDGSSQPWYVAQISSLSPVNSKLVAGVDLAAHFLKNFIYEGLMGWQLFKYKLITISLGFPQVCQLMDNFGGLLPLTRWSFTTE